MPIPFRVASFAWRSPAECKSKVTTSRLCPVAKSFLPGVASSASRRGNRRSNFCLSLAALGPLCGCVTIICLLRALMRTIGNGRLAACRSSRPLPKGAIQAGFASAVSDDRGVRSRRGGIMWPASLLRSAPSSTSHLSLVRARSRGWARASAAPPRASTPCGARSPRPGRDRSCPAQNNAPAGGRCTSRSLPRSDTWRTTR